MTKELELRVREIERKLDKEIVPYDKIIGVMTDYEKFKESSIAKTDKLNELDAKLDLLIADVQELKIAQLKDNNDLENRIIQLEASQQTAYKLIGLIGVILAVIEFALKFIV